MCRAFPACLQPSFFWQVQRDVKTQSLNHEMSHTKAEPGWCSFQHHGEQPVSMTAVVERVLNKYCFFPLSSFPVHDLLSVLCHTFTCCFWIKNKLINKYPVFNLDVFPPLNHNPSTQADAWENEWVKHGQKQAVPGKGEQVLKSWG